MTDQKTPQQSFDPNYQYPIEEEISFIDILAVIVKKRGLIFLFTSIFTFLSIAYFFLATPIYVAKVSFLPPPQEIELLSIDPNLFTQTIGYSLGGEKNGRKEPENSDVYGLNDEQLSWRRMKISELATDGNDGEISFKQEYPNNAAEAFQVTGGGQTLMSSDHCLKAREASEQGSGPLIIGVDPSRGGDRFAIIRRQGRKLYGEKAYVGVECDKLGKNVTICKDILDNVCPIAGKVPDKMFIDFGAGADIVDRLHELGYKDRVKAVHFGGSALNPVKYKNKRNEIWGELAAWMTDETLPVDIPDSDEIQADLCASPYDRDSNDRKVLWAKQKIKDKFGFSPDYGDAAALTHTEPVAVQKKPNRAPRARKLHR